MAIFTGTPGDDRLFGGSEDDELYGLEGNDDLYGAAGADLLDGGLGFDFAAYSDDFHTNLIISLQLPSINTGVAAGDTYVSIEGVIGGLQDDLIYGDPGDNTLHGMAGHDRLFGSIGADVLDGGALWDYACYNDASYAGLTADLANIIPGTGVATGDVFDDIEGLMLTQNADIGYGDEADNYLYGFGGDDQLDGRGGDDHLIGGLGDDLLTGGGGWDVFEFRSGDGSDTVTDFQGGWGLNDVLDMAGMFATYEEALAASAQVGADLVFSIAGSVVLTLQDSYRGNFGADDILL